MKNRTRAYLLLLMLVLLTLLTGLAFINNLYSIGSWWGAFHAAGGDAAQVPKGIPGLLPGLDWSVVDYSGVATGIPFLGFLLMTLGLGRLLAGRHQDPAFFPFFKGYDQLNIALGLIGTLWGIIIIGYFQMETVTMGDLMMCLHTALFSTLVAVVWVFIVDHSFLRPLALRVLRGIQGLEHEDEDILEVLDQLTRSAGGLCDVWNGNRERLAALNDAIAQAGSELTALGGIGHRVADTLGHALTDAATGFMAALNAGAEALAARQAHMEAAFAERQARLDASQREWTAALEGVAGLLAGMQAVQARFAAETERLGGENAELASNLKTARQTAHALREQVGELKGESEGRLRQIGELVERMRADEAAFGRRLDALREASDRLQTEKARVEAERQAAVHESDARLKRAERAEKLLERIKATFNP